MGWGDEMLAAGEAKRLHEATQRAVGITGARGEIRWHAAWENLPFIVNPAKFVPRGWAALPNHSGRRPYFKPPLTREGGYTWSGWKVSEHRPVLALTEAERSLGLGWRASMGDYVVIEPHSAGGNEVLLNRLWGVHRFRELVALRPDVALVQIGPESAPTLAGVRRVVTRHFREAAGVLSGAAAYVGVQGGLHHAAAALGIPAVIIFGGCEPPELMGYPENVNLASRLPGTPCGKILPCDHCKAAMEAITAEQVSAALTLLQHKRAQALAQGVA